MKKVFLGISFLFLMMLGAGCGTNDSSGGASELERGEEGFIQEISEERILVNDIYYDIANDTEIVTDKGDKLTFEDLEIGMKVESWHTGQVQESYPAQTKAVKITVLTDSESEKLREGVAAVIKYAEALGKPVILHSVELTDNNTLKVNLTAGLESDPIDIFYDYKANQVKTE